MGEWGSGGELLKARPDRMLCATGPGRRQRGVVGRPTFVFGALFCGRVEKLLGKEKQQAPSENKNNNEIIYNENNARRTHKT